MEGKQDEDGFEDDDGEEEDDNSDDDVEETLKQIQKVKKGLAADLEDEDDDEEDSDYDVLGGDMCLYDSRLDDIDELLFMKDTVDGLY